MCLHVLKGVGWTVVRVAMNGIYIFGRKNVNPAGDPWIQNTDTAYNI